MVVLLLVFLTAVAVGLGFWFYNRRNINSLTATIEDKNAVINSFRDHLTSPVEEKITNVPVRFNPEFESVVDLKLEKKKKRYNNRPKKSVTVTEPKQQINQSSEKKNKPNKQRRPKPQQ